MLFVLLAPLSRFAQTWLCSLQSTTYTGQTLFCNNNHGKATTRTHKNQTALLFCYLERVFSLERKVLGCLSCPHSQEENQSIRKRQVAVDVRDIENLNLTSWQRLSLSFSPATMSPTKSLHHTRISSWELAFVQCQIRKRSMLHAPGA